MFLSVILTLVGCGGKRAARGPDNELGMLEGGAWSQPPKPAKKTATIIDAGELYSSINTGDCLTWPSPYSKQHGGADAWAGWYPKNGMTGVVAGTSSHCSDTSVTVYIIDFGDGHFAALNNKGVQIGEGGATPPPVVASSGPSVKIVSAGKMYDRINEVTCLQWPSPTIKALGGKNAWGGWEPKNGDYGVAIGKSTHCSQSVTVVFVQIGNRYVPIDEMGIVYVTGSGASVPWVSGGAVATPPPPPPVQPTYPSAGAGTVESGRVRIVDAGEVYTTINTTDCLQWPDNDTKNQAGKNSWGVWSPKNGDVGVVVWKSAHCSGGNVVLVVRVGDKYLVPIGKKGVAPE